MSPEGTTTVGDRGSRSAQRSVRRVATMPPDTIRTLPFGTGLILLRAVPPVIAKLRMWTHRPDASKLKSNRSEIEALLREMPAIIDETEHRTELSVSPPE